MKIKIKEIKARQILNSRGYPTIETEIILENGIITRAAVPSGASKGTKEALELVDNNLAYYSGYSVQKAINNVNSVIKDYLINFNFDILDLKGIDHALIKLDGSENKSVLGANAILSVSLAACKAGAKILNLPLYKYFYSLLQQEDNGLANFQYFPPTPMLNVINGGVHADNDLAIQEFMIVPINFSSFAEGLANAAGVFYNLKKLLKAKKYSINVGDEGGFAPQLRNSYEALELLKEAIETAGARDKIKIALDAAASEFYGQGKYYIDQKILTPEALVSFYEKIASQYDIISIEDPCSEEDLIGWQKITKELGKKISLVGDDLFVTNPEIFLKGIENNIANSILIKMNQIGTITETIEAIQMARKYNYSVIISHRSGETEDTSIAHLAVACGKNTKIKAGSLARGERIAKYNEILRIEDNEAKAASIILT